MPALKKSKGLFPIRVSCRKKQLIKVPGRGQTLPLDPLRLPVSPGADPTSGHTQDWKGSRYPSLS